jgi:hypothetical protein
VAQSFSSTIKIAEKNAALAAEVTLEVKVSVPRPASA